MRNTKIMLSLFYIIAFLKKGLSEKRIAKITKSEGTLVFEKLGVLLKRNAIAAVDADMTIVNVFMKIPLQLDTPQGRCSKMNITKYQSIIKNRVEDALYLFQNFTHIEAELHRSKRSFLAGLLGGSLLSIATSTISGLLVNHNVNKLKTQFENFAKKTTQLEIVGSSREQKSLRER